MFPVEPTQEKTPPPHGTVWASSPTKKPAVHSIHPTVSAFYMSPLLCSPLAGIQGADFSLDTIQRVLLFIQLKLHGQ